MKVTDLIEALQTADKLFKKKHKKPLEIFDFIYHEDDFDGDLKIDGCGEVIYDSDEFGCGQTSGKKPVESIRIHFECEDGKIVDRSVEFWEDEA